MSGQHSFFFSFLPCWVIRLDFKFPTHSTKPVIFLAVQSISFFFLEPYILDSYKVLMRNLSACGSPQTYLRAYIGSVLQFLTACSLYRPISCYISIPCLISNFITTLFGKYNIILQLYSKFCSKLILGRCEAWVFCGCAQSFFFTTSYDVVSLHLFTLILHLTRLRLLSTVISDVLDN